MHKEKNIQCIIDTSLSHILFSYSIIDTYYPWFYCIYSFSVYDFFVLFWIFSINILLVIILKTWTIILFRLLLAAAIPGTFSIDLVIWDTFAGCDSGLLLRCWQRSMISVRKMQVTCLTSLFRYLTLFLKRGQQPLSVLLIHGWVQVPGLLSPHWITCRLMLLTEKSLDNWGKKTSRRQWKSVWGIWPLMELQRHSKISNLQNHQSSRELACVCNLLLLYGKFWWSLEHDVQCNCYIISIMCKWVILKRLWFEKPFIG